MFLPESSIIALKTSVESKKASPPDTSPVGNPLISVDETAFPEYYVKASNFISFLEST